MSVNRGGRERLYHAFETSAEGHTALGKSRKTHTVVRLFGLCYTLAGLPGSSSETMEWGSAVENGSFPKCQRCKTGDLVPLSDFGSQGAAIHYKAWACTNPECGYNLKIRNGDLYMDEPIASGAIHTPRYR